MFPTNYTQFKNKQDASYDGDPKGDYILAEHINKVQEAISSIEKAVGLETNNNKSLTDRIKALESVQTMRVPAIAYFSGNLGTDTSYLSSVFSSYSLVLLSQRSSITEKVLTKLKNTNTRVYGEINALTNLTLIQNEIGAWKSLGATGIYLTNLGEDASPKRSIEQDVLDSIEQAGMAVLIESSQLTQLLDDAARVSYNPTGEPIRFPKETIVQLDSFAYNERAYNANELMASTKPLIESIRKKGLLIAGFSKADTQNSFNYTQATALLFGLDYLHNGAREGYTIENRSPLYNWPSYLINWKTTEPVIFQEGTSLYRDVPNGRIWINDDLTIKIDGYELDSGLINWYQETIPGNAIKEGTIDPAKLSTYDIQRIVTLLNNSSEDIKIDATKIKADEGGGNLPINIPASNMIQNVIQAINQKNNVDSMNHSSIENWAIESLDAAKLTGNLKKEQLITHVIDAINESSTITHFIDVAKIKSIDIQSTGTLNANTIIADNGTLRAVNVTEGLTAFDMTASNYFTGNEGEFFKLYVEQLTVDKLMGLKELHVETLTADNIGSLVLTAIDANIANGTFNTIVTQALTAETIKADLVTALNSVTDQQITNTGLFGTAVIDDANIKNVSAGKLTSGQINTSLINLSSDAGHLKITDSTMQIFDDINTEGNRKLRVLIGNLNSLESEATANKYGMVVLGEDGSTRLYDNTGVYNAGLHNNVISEEKIQEDAISERVIRAGAIVTEHLQAGIINADKIGADAILAKHILAGEITGAKIAGETITGSNIQAGAVTAGHIKAGSIDASKIAANAITADKLTIGFLANLIRDGYDSFEQSEVGPFKGIVLAGTATGTITKDWSFDGDKSFYLMGNSASNRVRLAVDKLDYTIPVTPGVTYFVSAYVKTNSTNQTTITLGLAYNNVTEAVSPIKSVAKSDRVTRVSHSFTVPPGVLRASVILGVEATNAGVWFDCLQVEEMLEGQTEPGFWKATATTKINGDNIQTGYIDAKHIHIGKGTLFGTNNDIIDITDEGIKAKSQTGYAMLNSKGLEITGGAFSLTSGVLGENAISINGKEGILTETPLNRIELNALTGFRIIDKAGEQVLFDTDPVTGAVRIAGSMRIYDKDNPLMSWSMDEKMNSLESNVDTVLKDYVTSIDLEGIQEQIDGNIMSWFGSVEPTLSNVPAKDWTTAKEKDSHLGDLYYDDASGYSYRFISKAGVYSWLRITDSDITLALETANNAKDTADGKRRVFVAQPKPPYDIGDLWAGGGGTDLMRCIINRTTGNFAAADWEKAVKYTDDTTANLADEKATAAEQAATIAKGNAEKAQTAAIEAKGDAKTANDLLGDIANDNKLTAGEKSSLKVQWDSIVSEFEKNKASAEKQKVPTAAYHSAYIALSNAIGSMLSDTNLTLTSTVNGVALRNAFKKYYDERQVLLDGITEGLNQKAIDLSEEIKNAVSDNKTSILQGNPIFTDKADDAVVHVGVDGKSVGGGSGKNLIKGEWDRTITADATGAWVFNTINFDTLVIGKTYIFSADVSILAGGLKEGSNISVLARKANGDASIASFVGTTIANGKVIGTLVPKDEVSKIYLYAGTAGYTQGNSIRFNNLQLEQNTVSTSFERPAPYPDHPIPINSLDKSFDIVSSVGKENLLKGSNDTFSRTGGVTSINFIGQNIPELVIGDEYTFSVDLKADIDTKLYRPIFINSSNMPTGNVGSIVSKDWKRYVFHFKWAGGSYNGDDVHIHIYFNSIAGSFYARLPKLEEGRVESPIYYPNASEVSYNTQSPNLYKTNILLSEPLRSVGDVKDRVYLDDKDELWKVERNVGEHLINKDNIGSHTATFNGVNTFGVRIAKDLSKALVQGKGIVKNNFGIPYGYHTNDNLHLYFETSSLNIYIDKKHLISQDIAGVNKFFTDKPFTLHYVLTTPTIETLPQSEQVKLNNIQSFKGSNYVYTVEGSGSGSGSGSGVVPELNGVFKSLAFSRYQKSVSGINNLKQSIDAAKDINLGMKIGYSSFSVQTVNSLFFCGLGTNPTTLEEELVDANGSIFNRQTKETIVVPKQAISLSGVPAGTTGYIIWDNTSKQLHFTYYSSTMGIESPTSSAWKNQSGSIINMTDSVYIIGEIET